VPSVGVVPYRAAVHPRFILLSRNETLPRQNALASCYICGMLQQ
jgi:hypothetical protein